MCKEYARYVHIFFIFIPVKYTEKHNKNRIKVAEKQYFLWQETGTKVPREVGTKLHREVGTLLVFFVCDF